MSTKTRSQSDTLVRHLRRLLRPRSLTVQFTIGNSLIFLAVAFILPPSISRSIEAVSDSYFERQLERSVTIVASRVQWRDGAWHVAGDAGLMSTFLSEEGAAGFIVIDSRGHVIAGTPRNAASVGGAGQGGEGEASAFSYVTKRISAGREHVDVVVYRDRRAYMDFRQKAARDISVSILAFLATMLAVSCLLGLAVLLLARRSVGSVMREMAHIDPDHLDRRLSLADDLPYDLRTLVEATNAALDRIGEGYRLQGRFADTVAHELRTPIAALRLKCEEFPPSTQRDRLIALVDRLNHLLGQLRALGVLEGAAPDLKIVDLVEVVRDMVADLAPPILSSGHGLEYRAPDVEILVRVDSDYLATILDNLLRNAMSHTPTGTKIVVGVEAGGIVYVADDGPGMMLDPVLPASRARYLSTAGRGTGGSGLGLRIIARSIYLMGGEFTVRTGGPGCEVRIFLPRA